ncbi:MAG TPA: energy transducer TonB [Trichocoleus sp.]|jgi:outer membrane biosynthesis protein TonB
MSSSLRFQDLPTLQKAAQQWAKNPGFWAGITSLGLHGALFVLLPLLPYTALKTNVPEAKRSVGLVQLTPEEQARLPDFSTAPEIQLPSIAQAPVPQSRSDFSALPPIPNSSTIAPPPISPSFINPLPIPSFPIFIPPPIPQTTTQIPIPQTPASPAASPSPLPSASPSALPQVTQADPRLPNQPQTNDQSDVAASPQSSPQPSSTPQPSPGEQLIARQQELRRLYTYNPEGTTTEAALESYTGWLGSAVQWLGADWDRQGKAQELKLVGDYPKTACVRKLSGAAIVGVLVDEQGKVVEEPEPPTLLQSSGYPIFNDRALQAAVAHEFEATGKKQAYQVLVQFDGDEACPKTASPETPAG